MKSSLDNLCPKENTPISKAYTEKVCLLLSKLFYPIHPHTHSGLFSNNDIM